MHALWVNFVKTGIPAAPGLPEWTRWSMASRRYLNIDNGFKTLELPDADVAMWRDPA
jgi:para-nitrobenzyl esterase